MEYAHSNCTYTESHKPEHTYTFTGILTIYCKGKKAVTKKHSVTVKGPDLFKWNQGAYIQDAFPYLSPEDREFLKTGSCFVSAEDAESLMRESEIVSVAKALIVLVDDVKDLVQADSNKHAVTYFAKKMGMSKPNLLMCFEVKKTDRPKTYALKERTMDRRT